MVMKSWIIVSDGQQIRLSGTDRSLLKEKGLDGAIQIAQNKAELNPGEEYQVFELVKSYGTEITPPKELPIEEFVPTVPVVKKKSPLTKSRVRPSNPFGDHDFDDDDDSEDEDGDELFDDEDDDSEDV